MSKSEISYKSKQPKIKNIFIYIYCCISKIGAIIFFGLGVGLLVFGIISAVKAVKKYKKMKAQEEGWKKKNVNE